LGPMLGKKISGATPINGEDQVETEIGFTVGVEYIF
jgi:hypothetical protein